MYNQKFGRCEVPNQSIYPKACICLSCASHELIVMAKDSSCETFQTVQPACSGCDAWAPCGPVRWLDDVSGFARWIYQPEVRCRVYPLLFNTWINPQYWTGYTKIYIYIYTDIIGSKHQWQIYVYVFFVFICLKLKLGREWVRGNLN